MRISDWSSDVCSSDLGDRRCLIEQLRGGFQPFLIFDRIGHRLQPALGRAADDGVEAGERLLVLRVLGEPLIVVVARHVGGIEARALRSVEHTSELPYLMRISYDVFCLKN